MGSFCGKFWRGEYPLPMTYWVFGVLVPVTVSIGISLFVDRMDNPMTALAVARIFLGSLFSYAVLWMVSAWRAASRYQGPRQWVFATKTVVVFAGLFCFGLANELGNLKL